MSSIKNPQEKKRLSYERDCRNCYGENDKSSRKSIRRNKQLSSKKFRSAASSLTILPKYELGDELALEIENQVKTLEKVKRKKGFKKVPDQPLNKHVNERLVARKQRENRKQCT